MISPCIPVFGSLWQQSASMPRHKSEMLFPRLMKARVQKLIANSGLCSRRKAEKMIEEGRVKVNGKLTSLGDSADTDIDKISVDGKTLKLDKKVYLVLNKPAGYECTLRSTSGKPLVTDIVHIGVRIFPVGRLDVDSRGLVLLTNDGDFANNLIHPSSSVEKEYTVTVGGHVSDEQVQSLRCGIQLEEARTRPCRVDILKRGKATTLLRFVLQEGRKRQIRRMVEQIGLKVIDLRRERLGPITLEGLKEGAHRPLTAVEILSLENNI
jgi:23S rRNA pseudouridine2605 synthase